MASLESLETVQRYPIIRSHRRVAMQCAAVVLSCFRLLQSSSTSIQMIRSRLYLVLRH